MFHKYNSIDNSYDTNNIAKIKQYGYDDLEWIATEKIHGANFSVIYDGTTISFGRRTGILDKKEKFYHYQRIEKEYSDIITELFCVIKNDTQNLKTIQLYGELFGGTYKHIDIENIKGVSQVQSGIYYHPDIKFIPYDLYYTCSDEKSDYLSYGKLMQYVKLVPKMQILPIMRKGTLDELLKLEPDFTTTIPSLYDLPHIDDNFSEGYVLKPVNNIFFPSGERVILKYKRYAFKEIQSGDKKITVFNYLNENRLNAVLSKMTDTERENKDLVMQNLIEDAWEDIKKEHDINEFDVDSLTKKMISYARKFIKK